MHATVTLSWFGVFFIFFAGFAMGWAFSKHRLSSPDAQVVPGDPTQGGTSRTVELVKQISGVLTLKCTCGEVWKLAEGTGSPPPGTRPMPTGDCFVYPKCGNSMDLKAVRELEKEALAKLSLDKDTLAKLHLDKEILVKLNAEKKW